jgi:hypothetical protein
MKGQRKLSKKFVRNKLAAIGAILGPRVTASNGQRVHLVRRSKNTFGFPSLSDIMVWAKDPEKYDPNRRGQPVDTIPARWIMDEVKDPVQAGSIVDEAINDTKLAEEQ